MLQFGQEGAAVLHGSPSPPQLRTRYVPLPGAGARFPPAHATLAQPEASFPVPTASRLPARMEMKQMGLCDLGGAGFLLAWVLLQLGFSELPPADPGAA